MSIYLWSETALTLFSAPGVFWNSRFASRLDGPGGYVAVVQSTVGTPPTGATVANVTTSMIYVDAFGNSMPIQTANSGQAPLRLGSAFVNLTSSTTEVIYGDMAGSNAVFRARGVLANPDPVTGDLLAPERTLLDLGDAASIRSTDLTFYSGYYMGAAWSVTNGGGYTLNFRAINPNTGLTIGTANAVLATVADTAYLYNIGSWNYNRIYSLVEGRVGTLPSLSLRTHLLDGTTDTGSRNYMFYSTGSTDILKAEILSGIFSGGVDYTIMTLERSSALRPDEYRIVMRLVDEVTTTTYSSVETTSLTITSSTTPSVSWTQTGGFDVIFAYVEGTTLKIATYDTLVRRFSLPMEVASNVAANQLGSIVNLGDRRYMITWNVVAADGQSSEVRSRIIDTRTYGDTLTGTTGDDQMAGTRYDDSLAGGQGFDTLFGHDGTDILSGDDGDDVLTGGRGNDTLRGGGGDDLLIDAEGTDRFEGGSGLDLVSYEDGAAVTINLLTGVHGGAALGDVFVDVEAFFGSAEADRFTGGAGADEFYAAAGNDRVVGGEGADFLDGGAGVDIIDYTTSSAAVTVSLGPTAITASGGAAAGDSLFDFEAVYGSAYADRLTIVDRDGTLQGAGGDDSLTHSGTGTVSLNGGSGGDVFFSGLGIDLMDGASGWDTVDYSASTAGVTVDLNLGTGTGGFAQGDTLTQIEAIVGSANADWIIGNAIKNILSGGAGADTLDGGAGADTLIGGEGADRLIGGLDADLADYSGGTIGVTVNLSGKVCSGGDAAGDVLIGIENIIGTAQRDVLVGTSAANRLTGGLGADSINGGGGNDRIDGGLGVDTLTGGLGADTFVMLNAPSGAYDRITDFEIGIDHLEFSAAQFGSGLLAGMAVGGGVGTDGLAGTADDLPSLFRANSAGQATAATDRFLFNTTTGTLYFDADGSGAGARITLATGLAAGLSASDLLIVA